MKPATRAAWGVLSHAAEASRGVRLRDLFAADGQRFARLSTAWNDWLLDYSKQRVSAEIMDLLLGLWQIADVPGWIARMRAGEAINHSEGRAALHIALRHPAHKGPILHAGRDVMPATAWAPPSHSAAGAFSSSLTAATSASAAGAASFPNFLTTR